MKVLLFFIFVSIFSTQIKADQDYVKVCQNLVDKRLSKYNQFRFKKQCTQITSKYQFQCLTEVLDNRRAISLVEFNACTYVRSAETLASIHEVAKYYHSRVNIFHVTVAALVQNEKEKNCVLNIIQKEGLDPFNAYTCFDERGIDPIRHFAQMYIK
ncbi:hypothetical protein M902_1415 [Bacteriovorax sp. BAL6_X]|uniref:hypothetical protein n=1 Tax=Bacteriovorax sp. BAL6_X TaxID=1201290 RepID=UPI000386DBC8|nr:hypothetical protein [Bacteriovorax sp. BAL6_X]EPZ50524.1 hypothetical protein M902_1415 [Bacteriovorax sp. BAL6_X]